MTTNPDVLVPIYYLDDDVEALRAFEAELQPTTLNPVVGVQTVQELYDRVPGDEPAIIFVDLILPELLGGGYEVISTLHARAKARGHESGTVIAVIAVTGSSREETVAEAAYQAGAHAFLYKPIQAAAAMAAIIKPGWFRVQFRR